MKAEVEAPMRRWIVSRVASLFSTQCEWSVDKDMHKYKQTLVISCYIMLQEVILPGHLTK
jgi:hypothetical protein